MVIDRIENAHYYYGMLLHFETALRYLADSNMDTVEKVSLDNGAVSIAVMDYVSKPA